MQRGTCSGFSCTSTCSEELKATSIDHSICIPCKSDSGSSTSPTVGDVSYDETIGDCTCNNPPPRKAELKSITNYKLVEIYTDESGSPSSKKCMRCPYGSAVISRKLLSNEEEDEKFTTAGTTYYPNDYVCVECPDANMYFDTDYQCKCKDGYFIVGETSIAPQKCIKNTPTLDSDYAIVKFSSIRSREGNPNERPQVITLNSITFSHYYLDAASSCEFLSGQNIQRDLSACQTLANLCVMSHYDDSSVPCRQFKSVIMDTRTSSYRNQEDWKVGMPWLYYNYEGNDIVEDRSIQMTLSMKEREGSQHFMKYRLFKYSMDGSLIKMEELSDQFQFCVENSNNVNTASGRFWFKFGHSVRYENMCNLELLLDKEMYFYDLYLVDEGCNSNSIDSNDGSECLFPIPVLNKNLLQGGDSLPNRNNNFADEMDDIYTRRFFLFDNMVRVNSVVNDFEHSILTQAFLQKCSLGKRMMD